MNLVDEIVLDSRVRAAMTSFETDLRETVDLAIAVQQIPSPTFHEEE